MSETHSRIAIKSAVVAAGLVLLTYLAYELGMRRGRELFNFFTGIANFVLDFLPRRSWIDTNHFLEPQPSVELALQISIQFVAVYLLVRIFRRQTPYLPNDYSQVFEYSLHLACNVTVVGWIQMIALILNPTPSLGFLDNAPLLLAIPIYFISLILELSLLPYYLACAFIEQSWNTNSYSLVQILLVLPVTFIVLTLSFVIIIWLRRPSQRPIFSRSIRAGGTAFAVGLIILALERFWIRDGLWVSHYLLALGDFTLTLFPRIYNDWARVALQLGGQFILTFAISTTILWIRRPSWFYNDQ